METGKVQLTVREGAEPRGGTRAAPGYDGDQAGRETVSGVVVWVCHMSAWNKMDKIGIRYFKS